VLDARATETASRAQNLQQQLAAALDRIGVAEQAVTAAACQQNDPSGQSPEAL
jgi:hypothetical protein